MEGRLILCLFNQCTNPTNVIGNFSNLEAAHQHSIFPTMKWKVGVSQ